MDKKKKILLLVIPILCVSIIVLVIILKGVETKVQNTTEINETSEKEVMISERRQELSDIRTSDDSLPDMSEDEISSAVELLHEKGMLYEDITAQDLRHANDKIPEVKTYTEDELAKMTDIELAKAGIAAAVRVIPSSPLVFWVLPERIENGYDISINYSGSDLTEPRSLYDWEFAKLNYSHERDYLTMDEEQLKENIGKPYSEIFTNFNTYTAYHGLNADEYLSPGEEGRFVLLRWFKFKDSDKEGWAVCYVDVLNNSDEKHTKRDCPMMQVLFTI